MLSSILSNIGRAGLCLTIGYPHAAQVNYLQKLSRHQTSYSYVATQGVAGFQDHFDVVSIRPSSPSGGGASIRPQPSRFAATGVSLVFLVQFAYDIHDFQVLGEPDWAKSRLFDVVGKMDETSDAEKSLAWDDGQSLLRAMVKKLLSERFGLKLHAEHKLSPVYALVVGRQGPRLRPAKEATGYTTGPGQLKCSSINMDGLADLLSDQLSRTVVDKTGLAGDYQLSLRWTPESSSPSPSDPPGLFTSIQEQLGLKLEPDKSPVKVLIIDEAHEPSPN